MSDSLNTNPIPSEVVFSLHGIKTRGKWQKDVTPLLGHAGFTVVPLDFGNFLALQLLIPGQRERKVDWFRDEYSRQCDRLRCERPAIIAHSLGSYLVAQALEKFPEMRLERVILCGSIIRRDYSWKKIAERGQILSVLNQFGGQDLWARVVEWVVSDAGQSGLRGFEHSDEELTQQWNPKFKHSDYFYDLNYKENWIPFLQGNATVSNKESAHKKHKNWRYLITKSVILVALLVVVALAAWKYLKQTPPHNPGELETLLSGLSIFREQDQNSEIIDQLAAGQKLTLFRNSDNPNWIRGHAENGTTGWIMSQDVKVTTKIGLANGVGTGGDFWQLFFTSPQPQYAQQNKFGIDARYADAIRRCKTSLDIAVFAMNSRTAVDAVLDAHRKGVTVRIVSDLDSATYHNSLIDDLKNAGIPVITQKAVLTDTTEPSGQLPRPRSFMRNRFAILDGHSVWTGTWEPTAASTYFDNNNALVLTGGDIVARYQWVFEQMFEGGLFGQARKDAGTAPAIGLSRGVKILFSPDDEIVNELITRVNASKRSITFMATGFADNELAREVVERAKNGVTVRGLLETRVARFSVLLNRGPSSLKTFLCGDADIEIRLDSNPHFLRHSVMIFDQDTIATGSLADSGVSRNNDENLVILPDPVLADMYAAEFERLWYTSKPLQRDQLCYE